MSCLLPLACDGLTLICLTGAKVLANTPSQGHHQLEQHARLLARPRGPDVHVHLPDAGALHPRTDGWPLSCQALRAAGLHVDIWAAVWPYEICRSCGHKAGLYRVKL